MKKKDLEKAIEAFDDSFSHATKGALLETRQAFSYEDLCVLVDVLPQGNRLVIVHLGLEGAAMRYGFSFVQGKPDGSGLSYDAPGSPSHLLDQESFKSVSAAEWAPYHQAYRDDIRVDRDGSGPVALDKNDPRAVVILWDDEIDEMYQATTDSATGPFRLVLSSVSLYHGDGDGGPEGQRHGVAFHVEERQAGGWEPMLDDTDHPASAYAFKAADFGILCPPRCNHFQR